MQRSVDALRQRPAGSTSSVCDANHHDRALGTGTDPLRKSRALFAGILVEVKPLLICVFRNQFKTRAVLACAFACAVTFCRYQLDHVESRHVGLQVDHDWLFAFVWRSSKVPCEALRMTNTKPFEHTRKHKSTKERNTDLDRMRSIHRHAS